MSRHIHSGHETDAGGLPLPALALLVALLVALLLTSLTAMGCGAEDAGALNGDATRANTGEPTGPVPTGPALTSELGPPFSAAASATTAVDRAAVRRSVHERIMAEEEARRRELAAAAAAAVTAMDPDPANVLPAAETQTAHRPAAGQQPRSAIQPANQAAAAQPASVQPGSAVLGGGRTPIRGVWSGSAERLAAFLLAESPAPRFTVPVSVLAQYYVRYCGEAGLRADLLWAQMILETGYGRYGGDVAPGQNNYAGIGATGGGAPGVIFTSAQAGVLAHVAHMVAYVYPSSPVPWANANVDPRFDLVSPRGVAAVLADLDGRWAVPGHGYGEHIEAIAGSINSF